MEVLIILGGAAILYLLLENRNAAISSGISANNYANQNATHPTGNVLNGLVGFGSGPSFTGGPSSGQRITQEVGAGIGAGVAVAGTAISTGAITVGSTVAAAVPIIGTLAVVAIGIISAIEKHHQEAISAEGRALNQNDPVAIG